MKRLEILVLFVVALASLTFYQCEQKEVSELADVNQNLTGDVSTTEANLDGAMVLGKKLQIPYALAIVENAQNQLKSKSPNFKPIKVKENYLYVRFTPKSEAEYDLINTDSTLNTFNHPLDYEIIKGGSTYKDPNVKDYGFGSIYCVIPAENKFRDVKYDLLEKLYIPFGSGGKDNESKKLEKLKDENLEALDNEILEMTGFKAKNSKARPADWNPYGYIRVAPDFNNYQTSTYVPVQGCKVRTTKALVVTHSAITNTEGFYYITNSYWNISEVNYDIKWERDDYDIRDGAWGQAYTIGPKLGTGWSLNIGPSLASYNSYLYAWVNNAADYYYYHSAIMGLQPPPSHTPRPPVYGVLTLLLPQKMKMKVTTGWSSLNTSHYLDYNSAWNAAQISLLFLDSGQTSTGIVATTSHELGHASHWSLGYSSLDYAANLNYNRKYAESWAQCIGWFAAAKYFSPYRYINYNNTIFPNNIDYYIGLINDEPRQALTLSQQKGSFYTSAFIDLVDAYKQANCPETASGYTMSQIEVAISKNPKNWDSIKNRLKTDYPNHASKTQMEWIFDNYK